MLRYLVKSTSHCLVQAVGDVGSAQDQDTGSGGGDPLHLHQELGLDTPCGLALTLSSGAAQGINLHAHSMSCSHNECCTAGAVTGFSLKAQKKSALIEVAGDTLSQQSSGVSITNRLCRGRYSLQEHRKYVHASVARHTDGQASMPTRSGLSVLPVVYGTSPVSLNPVVCLGSSAGRFWHVQLR